MSADDTATPPGQTLAQHFAYFTECAWATVEDLELVKSTPKHRLERARSIARGMTQTCLTHKIPPSSGRIGERHDCTRLAAALEEMAAPGDMDPVTLKSKLSEACAAFVKVALHIRDFDGKVRRHVDRITRLCNDGTVCVKDGFVGAIWLHYDPELVKVGRPSCYDDNYPTIVRVVSLSDQS